MGYLADTNDEENEWDQWIGLHATRNEVAENYAIGLRTHGLSWPHWPNVNAAILRRWSPAGLSYIKEQAWKKVAL